jgi:type I restriction enzyme S subunit
VNWTDIRLGDVLAIKHGFAFKSRHFESSGKYVVVTPGNFNEAGGFRLRPDKERYYGVLPPDDFVLEPGDLILAMTEQGEGLLGSCAIVPNDGAYLHNQRIGLVEKLDTTRIDQGFLFHLFNTGPVRAQIRATASGTKVRHTSPNRIYSVTVRVPPLSEQAKIAEKLSAYDELIENNRRRIRLLEDSARLTYREWFVDLKFPGHEHAKFIDGCPSGWQRKTLGDIADTNGDSYREKELPSEVNYVDISCVERGRILSKTHILGAESPGRARRKALDGDVIWSNVRPNLCAYALILEPEGNDVFSTGFTVLRPKGIPFSWLYLTVTTDLFVGHLVNHASGVGYPAVRSEDFKRYPIVLPPSALLDLFHENTEPKLRLISKLSQQNAKLVQARDILQPRLMSGEIMV